MNKESFFSWKKLLPPLGVFLALGAIIALLVTALPVSSHAASAIPTITASPASTTAPPILYEIHNDRSIWQYTGTPLTGWKEIGSPNTQTASIVATKATLYQLHLDGTIWQYTGTPLTGWKEIDNSQKAGQISVSVTGELYKEYQSDGSVWKYTGTPLTGWVQIANTTFSTIGAAGPNGALYIIRDDGIWKYTGTPITGWQLIDNTMVGGFRAAFQVIAGADGKVYDIRTESDNTDSLWMYNNSGTSWTRIDSGQNFLAAEPDGLGKIYGFAKSGTIWKYNGSWTSLNNPQPATTMNLRASVGGTVFQILHDNSVWLYNGKSWTEIDTNPTTFFLASSSGGIGVNFAG